MQQNSFLLYGANGYTGRLITELAATYHLQPTLAGRNEAELRSLAQQYQLPYRIATVTDTAQLTTLLSEFPVVLNVAGPFTRTAQPMIEACLHTHTHYLDITGEVQVLEQVKQYNDKAKAANIMLLSGAGFDVVPTDCLALFLKNRLPDADQLTIAFTTVGGGVSHGTATSMAEQLGNGGAVRQNGNIVRKPLGHKGRWIDFGEKKDFVMTIPWGDIATAYFTTGIPNIECYTGMSKNAYRLLKLQGLFNPLLRTGTIRNWLKKQINKRPSGPSAEQRSRSKSLIWGEVKNKAGETVRARITCLDGYTFTAHSSLLITQKVLAGNAQPGYQTPASAFGAGLLLEVPGSSINPTLKGLEVSK